MRLLRLMGSSLHNLGWVVVVVVVVVIVVELWGWYHWIILDLEWCVAGWWW